MLTRGEDVEAHALRKRGWSYSAIARHLGRDRRTVTAYLNGEREPGRRRRSAPDSLERFVPYLRERFAEDPHVWASALFDEVVALGYDRSYPHFVRQVRGRALRPHCEACWGVKGRDVADIDHPPGEEIQWDWFERRRAPWGGTACVLLGPLAYSGRVGGQICEATNQPHLIEAMDAVLRKLGGTARVWRVDRMATVVEPATGDVQASLAPVAKHYGASVAACPPRRGNRKGVVEAAVRFVSGRWWRTLSAATMEEAQASLDRFCATIGDARLRPPGRYVDPDELDGLGEHPRWPTVAELADAEPLLALPAAAYPATVEVTRTVADNAVVPFRGNYYSVPPGLGGSQLTVRHRLGTGTVEIHAPSGVLIVSHRLAPAGAGATVRSAEHAQALERAVLSSFTTAPPCDRKANRPPGPGALAEAARLLGDAGREPTVDLAAVARLFDTHAGDVGEVAG
jgi:transposase